MNPYVKTYTASGAIGHRRFVKFSAAGVVIVATAITDEIIGVADAPGGAVNGADVDIVVFGPAEVEAGGAVSAGNFVTAGAAGVAVAAAPAAGVNAHVGGRALDAMASGDFAKIFINPGRIQG